MEMAVAGQVSTQRYAKCIEVSKRVRFDIERDVIRGRKLDFAHKFLPDGLSRMGALEFLTEGEKRVASQIQGRTYANMFGLVERFIGAEGRRESAAATGSATRPRSRRWCALPTRSSSTRSCSAAWSA